MYGLVGMVHHSAKFIDHSYRGSADIKFQNVSDMVDEVPSS